MVDQVKIGYESSTKAPDIYKTHESKRKSQPSPSIASRKHSFLTLNVHLGTLGGLGEPAGASGSATTRLAQNNSSTQGSNCQFKLEIGVFKDHDNQV